MLRNTLFVLAMTLLAASEGIAKSKAATDPIEVGTYEEFKVLVVRIREEMVVGGRYEFLRGKDRDLVNQRLDAMAMTLESGGSVANLPADEKSGLMADQQAVNDMLARFADNRVICTYEAPIGSLIPKKRCRTLRQIEKTRSGSRGQIMDIQKDANLGGE